MADAAKLLTENTARAQGGQTLNVRYIELIIDNKREEDPRECKEIAADIWKRIRGEKNDSI